MTTPRIIEKQNWSEELKLRTQNFWLKLPPSVSPGTLTYLVELIVYARKQACSEACEACEKIDVKDAYQAVLDNPPDCFP